MLNRTLYAVAAAGLPLLFVGMSVQSSPPGALSGATVVNKAAARNQFLMTNQRTRLAERAGRINRVYGAAFSTGATPEESAERFRLKHARMFGVEPQDLLPVGPFRDGRHLQPIMYDRDTTEYKFTGVYYTQHAGGVPVFRSRLTLLIRNEAGYPLVLAGADLRDLGEFTVNPAALGAIDPAAHLATVLAVDPRLIDFTEPEYVIWAGVDDMIVEPRLAITFVGDSGIQDIDRDKWLYVTDAATGAILYRENQILEVAVIGNVSGMATEVSGAEQCEAEVATPMPYARVTIGAEHAFADANGDYTHPNTAGIGDVVVESAVRGQYFVVTNIASGGSDALLTQTVTPPGPANFVHNSGNTEFTRGEVNAYIQANVVRDFALNVNPAYPVIGGNLEFSITVNEGATGFCPGNAQYQGDNLRFCAASVSGDRPNTAWSSVIYHEYGHHLVATGGSGQGAYGEGMSDVTSLIITDESGVGFGFFGDGTCGTPLRDADNNCQYSPGNCSTCGSAIHTCGTLISGCVWETRVELLVTEPLDYRDIIADLAINSILLHSGSSITPSITIDFLTLDDDDADILNGTPHYTEINNGFSAHGMPGPEISLIAFAFPSGLPDLVAPDGTTSVPVDISSVTENPVPGTGKLFVDSGGGFVEIAMIEIVANSYDAVFPATPCGSALSYYFSADTDGGNTATWPSDAPLSVLGTISANGLLSTFSDDFQSDLGWSVTTSAQDGPWERAVPIPNSTCDRGNPGADADGSGMCYVTDNSAAGGCNSDVDNGSTTLTSPNMDATDSETLISYWRWYDNTAGSNPNQDTFLVEVSDNGGSSWTTLELVGPAGAGSNGGWFEVSYRVRDFVGNTTQFRIRFTASDTDPQFQSVVEAGVDGVKLEVILCNEEVFGDLNGDGIVGINDLLQLLGDWGACPAPCPPSCVADLDGDCKVGINDFLLLLANWTP
ncbi:MAG: hypothetical protein V3S08_08450 [Phycisphaerales bacterium]